jgi:hypothetical protein
VRSAGYQFASPSDLFAVLTGISRVNCGRLREAADVSSYDATPSHDDSGFVEVGNFLEHGSRRLSQLPCLFLDFEQPGFHKPMGKIRYQTGVNAFFPHRRQVPHDSRATGRMNSFT